MQNWHNSLQNYDIKFSNDVYFMAFHGWICSKNTKGKHVRNLNLGSFWVKWGSNELRLNFHI